MFTLHVKYGLQHFPNLEQELETILGRCSNKSIPFEAKTVTRDVLWQFNTKEECVEAHSKIMEFKKQRRLYFLNASIRETSDD